MSDNLSYVVLTIDFVDFETIDQAQNEQQVVLAIR
jgi:hypothetical protein